VLVIQKKQINIERLQKNYNKYIIYQYIEINKNKKSIKLKNFFIYLHGIISDPITIIQFYNLFEFSLI
jgi:hypothetical protein